MLLILIHAMAKKPISELTEEDSDNGRIPAPRTRPVFEARITDEDGHTTVRIGWKNDVKLRALAKRLVWWVIVPTAIILSAMREFGLL